MTPPRRPRSVFTALTEGIYWFVVIDVLLVLASFPTVLAWGLLTADASNVVLLVISTLPVAPAVSAALYAWRARSRDTDLVPASRFLHGYRVNLVDSLKIALPAIAILAVLSANITYGAALGTASLSTAFLVIGALVLLLLTRAITVVSQFSFRFIDVVRLSIFTLLTKPLSTLALLSLGVLTVGLAAFVGGFSLLLAASLLTFALWSSERPIARLLAEQFTAPAPEAAGEPEPRPAS